MVLSFLRENAYLDTRMAAEFLQYDVDSARGVLDRLSLPRTGILERRGRTRATTYHLTKGLAKELFGKAAYTRTRGIDPARYREIVRQFVVDHGLITPAQCRELLLLGDSNSARVQVSRYLKKWSGEGGFLEMEGRPPRHHRYVLRNRI